MIRARRTQRERTADTRSALVEAAIALLMERGMAGASVPDICKAAGVTTGAVQHHFGSKAGLMAEVTRQLFDPIDAAHEAEARGDGPLADRIRALVELHWATYGADRYYAMLEILLATRHDPELMALVAERRRMQLDQLDRMLPVQFADVDLPPRALRDRAHAMTDFLRGYAVHRIYERDAGQDRAAIETACEMLDRAFRPRLKGPAPR